MYEFYFAYCEAGFANGLIHDYQITWKKSHLASIKPRTPSASSTSTSQSAAAGGGATEEEGDAGLDPLTATLLLIWCALVVTLVVSKRHMAIIGATCAGFFALRVGLHSRKLIGMPFHRASTFTAVVAAISLVLGSLTLIYKALYLTTPSYSLTALSSLILNPTTPPKILDLARGTVGTAAGFAALRAWECVRDPKQRSLIEALGYTASLICTSAALFYDTFLISLAPAQLCEAHSLLLRIRSLRATAGKPPSSHLWTAIWLSFFLLRLLPHLSLLALFTTSHTILPPSARLALVGLSVINLNNLAIGWGMLRAQKGEERTAVLAATQHRSTEGSTTTTTTATPPPATSPPTSTKWVIASLLTALGCTYLTLQQEPPCAKLIACTSLFYLSLYTLMRATSLFQPAAGTLKPSEHAEWRSRVGSTLNAIILIIGSLLCFSEWPYQGDEGWVSDHLWSHPVTFASLFVGYLQFDLCWVMWHQSSVPDTASAIHHSLFIAITHYVLWGWYFKQPYAWLSFAELSTPFLNFRWFLAVLGRKEGTLYFTVSLCFALSFLLTRVLGYGLGLYDLWNHYTSWKDAKVGLYMVVVGCHLGFVLNLYWSQSVVGALVRAAKGGGGKAKAE